MLATLALHAFLRASALPLVAPQQELRRLNPPLPEAHGADVRSAAIAPGERVVYVDSVPGDLYSVPIDGGTPIRLNSRSLAQEVAPAFLLDAVSGRVLFRAKRLPNGSGASDVDRAFDLFSAPIDGSQPAVLLHGRVYEGALSDFRATPSGERVVFRSPSGFPGPPALYSVPIEGGRRASIETRGSVLGVTDFRILPDSTQVVYRVDRTAGNPQLYRAPVMGNSTPLLLSGPAASAGPVEPDFELLPDGSQVIYRADLERDGSIDLLALSLAQPAQPRKLSTGPWPGGDVQSFAVSPDGARVVYAGDLGVFGERELYSVRIDMASPCVRLHEILRRGAAVLNGFAIDAGSERVVFRVAYGDACTLQSAPIDGSRPADLLESGLQGRDSIADDFRITHNGKRVVFRADPDQDRVFDLFSSPITGWVPPVLLGRAALDFETGPGYVLFRAEETPGVPELFGAPPSGAFPATRVHQRLPFGHAVLARYQAAADGQRAIFLADPSLRGVFELFRVGPRTPRALLQLSPDGLRAATGQARVQDFVLAGGRALYRAPQQHEDVVGLHSVPLDGSAPPRTLSPPLASAGGVLTRVLTPDGARVVFVQGAERGRRELYSAPTDGGAATLRLDAPAQPGCDVEQRFVLTPDGRSVLFVADRELDETAELYRVAVDGSAAPVRVHPALLPGRSVQASFQVTADGTRVVYVSDASVAQRFDLHVAALDGRTPPRQLSRMETGGGDVRQVQLAPDGAFALYIADQDQDEEFELLRVPLDGSLPPLQINAALVPHGDVREFAVDPSGMWVVYLADQETDEALELYSAPLDGSAPPVKLNPPVVSRPGGQGGVGSFRITPAGGRVVFLAAIGNLLYLPHVAPLDGSAPALRLDGSHGAHLPSWDYRITADAARLVYRVHIPGLNGGRPGIFCVPLDGSRAPVVLHLPGGLGEPWALAPDGASVVYSLHPPESTERSFWRVPVDGPREASVELFKTQLVPSHIEQGEQALVLLANGELYSF